MNLEHEIAKVLVGALNGQFEIKLTTEDINLQPTRKEFEGTYTFVVFPFLKQTKLGPEQTAESLGSWAVENSDLFAGYNVVKGFLNFQMSDSSWKRAFEKLDSADSEISSKKMDKVMVEYSSPNTNKPLHLGHLRNNFLGHAMANIYEALGHEVIRVQIINDRGIHICKSMVAWKKFGKGETPESSGLKGDKLVGKYYVEFDRVYKSEVSQLVGEGLDQKEAEQTAPIMKEAQEMLRAWEAKDSEVYALWKKMNEWVYTGFDTTYKTMGVSFDRLYYESDTYLLGKEQVMEGVNKGVFFEKDDGSVWVDLTDDGLDQKILLRSDGTAVYMTQDIGTAILRFEDFPGLSHLIYTVGNEQDYHFKVLFLILKKLGFEWSKGCFHLSYGMVDLPSGKMKSREGTVVDADDLMAEMEKTAGQHTEELGKIEGFSDVQAKELYRMVGLGALKYFLLKVDAKKRILFNPAESIQFQGNTGPFIQYTHARIQALLRKAKEIGYDEPDQEAFKNMDLLEPEIDIIYVLTTYSSRLNEAAEEHSPSIIAQYSYDLAKAYNKFYQEISIFNEPNKDKLAFRIMLSDQVARTISRSMAVLGIEVPDRM